MIYGLLVSPLLLIVGYWTVFYCYQRRWLFPFHKLTLGKNTRPKNGESVWLVQPFGRTEIWWLKGYGDSKQKPTVIVAHGQLGLIDSWEDRMEGLRQRGFNCALVEFPGYGRSEGAPSEVNFIQTMVSAYDWLTGRDDVDSNQMIGLGRSMGGGVISLLVGRRPLANLWLMSTFTSLRPFVTQKWVPGFLVKDPLDNLKTIGQHRIPTLIIHGTLDQVVPVEHGRQLASAAHNAILVLEKAGHDNCPLNWDEFWQLSSNFYQRSRTTEDLVN